MDHQLQERLRQEANWTNVQEFAMEQQNCGIRNLWLVTSDSQFQRRAIERQIQECLKKQRSQTEERRKRSEVQFYLFAFGLFKILLTANQPHRSFYNTGATFVLFASDGLTLPVALHPATTTHLLLACLCRLHALLQEEEEQLLQEMEAKHKEATAERQAWMREQVKVLRGKREEERQQILAEKNEQLFR